MASLIYAFEEMSHGPIACTRDVFTNLSLARKASDDCFAEGINACRSHQYEEGGEAHSFRKLASCSVFTSQHWIQGDHTAATDPYRRLEHSSP